MIIRKSAGLLSLATALTLGCGIGDIFSPVPTRTPEPSPTNTRTPTCSATPTVAATTTETLTPTPQDTDTPVYTPFPLVVEPYNSSLEDGYPSLDDLSDTRSGDYHRVTVHADEPAILSFGWAHATMNLLYQDLSHISWTVAVDSQNLPVNRLYRYDHCLSNIHYCSRRYTGIIRTWSVGEHVIEITMTLDTALYPYRSPNLMEPGDYMDVYIITVLI
ncbi:MAG: hypothetical protein ACK2UB_09680 [Anaerolineales bacterium]